tara:strand:+ start:4675 stop:4848 length:174 start_codon:yes stop_codon:yes gene_type:complete
MKDKLYALIARLADIKEELGDLVPADEAFDDSWLTGSIGEIDEVIESLDSAIFELPK